MFLNTLFEDVLGRRVDPAGSSFFGNILSSSLSTDTRLLIVESILSSPESNMEQIQQDYATILNRPAEQSALLFWTAAREQGASEELVQAAILGSDENYAN